MRSWFERAVKSEFIVYAACAASFGIGLFFIFVWSPQPWGREGFDHYHEFALDIARGRPFPTMEVPWGYAYFLAAFYRLFGDHPWIPLVVQAALNAAMPALVYRFAITWLDRGTAGLAAVLTGLLSFNTVYASTQSADVSGRVFEASGNVFAIAESWHRGPTAEPVDDPTQIDAIARKLLADARPNADMQGRDRRE